MDEKKIEFAAGLFILCGLILVAYLAFRIGDLQFFGERDYRIYARFSDVGGLSAGSSVRMAGVPVGTVTSVQIDTETFFAVVELRVSARIELDDDTMASIKTAGLIGDKYVSLLPGASGVPMKPGDMIVDTESALDIEGIVSRFAFGDV